ncbi:MAG TPA: hypothetical protein VFT87_04690 [Candidatus Saccharimonadales bacterium]|nr:hypothetical protein [Candidatus Saccharimonadales bacterium]
MEKGLPNIPRQEFDEQPSSRVSGFLERWRKKVQSEKSEEQPQQLPEQAVTAANDQEIVATLALKKMLEHGEEARESEKEASKKTPETPDQPYEPPETEAESAPITEAEALYVTTKKMGGKVLRFATALLHEAEELPVQEKTELAGAVHELDESQQHLTQELEGLEEAHSNNMSDAAQQHQEFAPPQIIIEQAEKKENKVPAFIVAQLAVLAIAGAGIFMAALDGEHRREHRILKAHRRKTKQALDEQAEELHAQEQVIANQQETLKGQAAQLQQFEQHNLETVEQKKRSAFVHEVSELTEQQAEITHEVTEKLQAVRPVAGESRAEKPEVIIATPEAAEAPRPPKPGETTQSGGAGGPYSPASHQNATLLQKVLQAPLQHDQAARGAKPRTKDVWVYVAIVTTLIIASVGWLMVQLVIN